jgi:hypothetical protein|tara:strand:+ start:1569 stop:2012 length:444 start_codon:yes stop_codon:yes gene_type:complete
MSIDIDKILLEFEVLPPYDTQISLQTVEGCVDPNYGTGWMDGLDHAESEFIIPLFDMPYTNSIIKDLGMFRTRVMAMRSNSCYSYHQDDKMRIHIPLITNDKCFMVIEDKVSRYPADGNYYLIDTTKIHTAINGSPDVRIHIVGCIN